MSNWEKFEKFIEKLSKGFFSFSGIAIICILLLSVIDIVGNKFFKFPLPGGIDIVGLVAVFVVTFAIAEVQVIHGHIEVEIVEEHLPKKVRRILGIFISLLGLLLWAIIAWRSFLYGIDLIIADEMSMTIGIPLAPFVLIQGICSLVVCLILFTQMVNNIRMVNK